MKFREKSLRHTYFFALFLMASSILFPSAKNVSSEENKNTQGRVIYGPDDRKDWFEIQDQNIRRLAAAAVALFAKTKLAPAADNSFKLKTKSLGQSIQLCPDEKFAEQNRGAYCSGILVGSDIVATAGHCIQEISGNSKLPSIGDIGFVFGFRVNKEGDPGEVQLRSEQIYFGKEVLAGDLFGNENDWAVIRLDRPVPPTIASPITNIKQTRVQKNDKVYVIGYPSGIPLKYAPNAEVRESEHEQYFIANLDTFGGNSGSGVFDQITNELVGILVRGDTDYRKDNISGCNRVNECPSSGCNGESVTRITVVEIPN